MTRDTQGITLEWPFSCVMTRDTQGITLKWRFSRMQFLKAIKVSHLNGCSPVYFP